MLDPTRPIFSIPNDPAPRLVSAWLLTGISDGTFATVLSVFFFNSTFARLWKGVAAVPLGPDALKGGNATVMIGILLHFTVALTWSAIFLFLLMRSASVRRILASPYGVLKMAAIYGPLIWLFMSLIVIPSFLHKPPTITVRWWVQLIGHIPFVAFPMITMLTRGLRARLSDPYPSGSVAG